MAEKEERNAEVAAKDATTEAPTPPASDPSDGGPADGGEVGNNGQDRSDGGTSTSDGGSQEQRLRDALDKTPPVSIETPDQLLHDTADEGPVMKADSDPRVPGASSPGSESGSENPHTHTEPYDPEAEARRRLMEEGEAEGLE